MGENKTGLAKNPLYYERDEKEITYLTLKLLQLPFCQTSKVVSAIHTRKN
jgi:hypothetical protein